MLPQSDHLEYSQAVQAHLGITQSVIQRMAANSASCKAWCITLVSAILVIVADKGKPQYTLIAAIPTALFLLLDTYYLALEKRFRESYNAFIDKLHSGKVAASDLYAIQPAGNPLAAWFAALTSFSTLPFYGTLVLIIWLTRKLIP